MPLNQAGLAYCSLWISKEWADSPCRISGRTPSSAVRFFGLAEQTKICVFGLGEAGSLIATDLQKAGAEVSAFDPADVATPEGVKRFVHPSLAARPADLVLSVTSGSDAKLALLQSLEAIRSDAIYADLSSSSPQQKSDLATYAERRELKYADVALMSMVPGNGVATISLAAGSGAHRYVELLNDHGGRAQVVDGPPGTAVAKKLLRSVMMKGTAAVMIEAVRAGAEVDDLEWLWSTITTEVTGADERWVRRLITGSKMHAARRTDEMQAAADMLTDLGLSAVMTQATVQSLTELIDGELPTLPESDGRARATHAPPRSSAERAAEAASDDSAAGESAAGDAASDDPATPDTPTGNAVDDAAPDNATSADSGDGATADEHVGDPVDSAANDAMDGPAGDRGGADVDSNGGGSPVESVQDVADGDSQHSLDG
jgi:3-hydroxyisobutyrate dehydrogenase-like beta-hydroxyacid dehydrogenase